MRFIDDRRTIIQWYVYIVLARTIIIFGITNEIRVVILLPRNHVGWSSGETIEIDINPRVFVNTVTAIEYLVVAREKWVSSSRWRNTPPPVSRGGGGTRVCSGRQVGIVHYNVQRLRYIEYIYIYTYSYYSVVFFFFTIFFEWAARRTDRLHGSVTRTAAERSPSDGLLTRSRV